MTFSTSYFPIFEKSYFFHVLDQLFHLLFSALPEVFGRSLFPRFWSKFWLVLVFFGFGQVFCLCSWTREAVQAILSGPIEFNVFGRIWVRVWER
jgi:hypothetical protein